MSKKNTQNIIITDETIKDIRPAKDRVSEDGLMDLLERHELEPVVDIDLIAEYKEDPRFGDRWMMQKAICLLLTDFTGRITIAELAYVIDTWFEKPNYGIARAKADVNKFRRKAFQCQHVTKSSDLDVA